MSPVGDMEAPQPRPAHPRSVGQDSYIDWDEVYVDNVSRIHPLPYVKVGKRPDAEDLGAEVSVAALGPPRNGASPCPSRSPLGMDVSVANAKVLQHRARRRASQSPEGDR